MIQAAAIFAGLALIAGAVAWHGQDSSGAGAPDYAAYERVVRAYVGGDLDNGRRIYAVERMQGSIYRVRFGRPNDQRCILIDPAKQYESGSGYEFWINDASCDG